MEVLVRQLIPTIARGAQISVSTFQSKQDLLEKFPSRIRGYAKWLPKDYRLVVLVDQDDDSCLKLKKRLEQSALDANLSIRKEKGAAAQVIVRIVIEELQSWFFGDWDAVRSAYPKVSATIPRKEAFRDPDSITGGTWESFEKILQRAGYFQTGLRKIEAARKISAHMDPARNRSKSFQVFRQAMIEAIESSTARR